MLGQVSKKIQIIFNFVPLNFHSYISYKTGSYRSSGVNGFFLGVHWKFRKERQKIIVFKLWTDTFKIKVSNDCFK